MRLARVVGTCVATRKAIHLQSQRFLVIQPVDFERQPDGHHVVCVDVVGANRGELVWWVASREAANALEQRFSAVDAAVVGIVDELQMFHGPGHNGGEGGDVRPTAEGDGGSRLREEGGPP